MNQSYPERSRRFSDDSTGYRVPVTNKSDEVKNDADDSVDEELTSLDDDARAVQDDM